jgi:GNAT superfamily N-acetyltransferase
VGAVSYDWLFVELLFVPEADRGRSLGTALIGQAEALARKRGCVGLWLETFAFQARGFYERLGFTVFGTLEDNPVGHSHFFLRKRF